jgi:hypothetical protein
MIIVDDIFDFAGNGGHFELEGRLGEGSLDDLTLILANTLVAGLLSVHGIKL